SPLWLTATRALQPIAFGIFASLLPRDALTSPAERMTAVLSALRFHGGTAPTTLIIDDIHLLDDSSAEVVLQAMTTRAVALVATAVSGHRLSEAIGRLVDDSFVEVIELHRFGRDAVEQIAAFLLGGPPATSTTELLRRWSGGLPGTLHDLVDTGLRTSSFRLVNGSWWWEGPPPALSTVPPHLQRQFDALSDTALDALDLVVLGDQIEADALERLVGGDPMMELERAGLVETIMRDDVMTVRFLHAHLSPQRRWSMPALRRRVLARRLLAVLPAPSAPSEIARSVSLHSYADRTAESPVVEAATSMLRLSDPHSAHAFADAKHRAASTVTSAADLVDSLVEVGDSPGAQRLLVEAWSLAKSPTDIRRVTEAAFAVALFADRDPHAAQRILDDRRRIDSERGLDVGLPISLDALAALLCARPDTAERLARVALDDPSETSRLRAGVATVAGMLMRGRTEQARTVATGLLTTAHGLTEVMPSALGMLLAEIAFIQLWRGELTAVPVADPLTGRWPAPPLADEPPDRRIDWSLLAGIVAHLRGEHSESVVRLNEAVVQQQQGKGIFHAEASAWLVVALCDAGRIHHATRALQQFPERHLAILPGLQHWAGGVVASARGHTSEAITLLTAAATEARHVGADLIEARYLVELAERCDDDSSIARLDELSRTIDAPLLVTICNGAIAKLKGDSGALLTAAARLDELGVPGRAKALARDAEALALGSGEHALARQA
ncbi:MAG TPA: hypothetical protein VES40_19330, partial [Ilumatobacteraceae bacterium]|nr:hypothetical protein [Ilumatobacteraceae bacterium]